MIHNNPYLVVTIPTAAVFRLQGLGTLIVCSGKKIDFVQAPADPSNPSAIQPINEIVRPVWNVQFLGEEDLPE